MLQLRIGLPIGTEVQLNAPGETWNEQNVIVASVGPNKLTMRTWRPNVRQSDSHREPSRGSPEGQIKASRQAERSNPLTWLTISLSMLGVMPIILDTLPF